MRYERTKENEIRIYTTDEFDPKDILDCGQVFRYRNEGDCHTIISKDKICLLQKSDSCVIMKTESAEYFTEYFDLGRDYAEIKAELSGYEGLGEALRYGKGIRILRQDPFETIISFIVSANNNIPRIKGILERMCRYLGEEKDGYHAFPTAERMAEADVEFYRSIGAGYRAEYLKETAEKLVGYDYGKIRNADTDTARKILTGFKGVGNKVADCIMLFAFGKTDLFPMDTWSKKIYRELGFPEEKSPVKMAEKLVKVFGKNAGYAQQYLYYYYRSK